jgi:SWI/SNF-related matrix-associated actin-dependent regulator of chromatin subfamily A3
MLSNLTVKLVSNSQNHLFPVTAVTVQGKELRLSSDPDVVVGTFDAFTAKILSALMAQDGLHLQSYVGRQSQSQRRFTKDRLGTLSVVVYGQRCLSESVGTFLLQCNLHLQDPKHCDRRVVYGNPQSLIQDYRMTQEQDFEVLQEIHEFASSTDLLVDLEAEDGLVETDTPHAIGTELQSHQKQALTFMLRREKGWAFAGPGKDIWRAYRSQGNVEYTNTISGEVSYVQPPDFRGGLLADQMGLGKSLSIIALIARDLEATGMVARAQPFNNMANPTLVVVRAALLQTWEHQLHTHVIPGKMTWRLHHEKTRIRERSQLENTNIVITTYHTLMSEWKKHECSPQIMYTTHWRRVVLDEAHDIRDHRSMIARAMCALEATSRWALSGTPVQNRIADLASLFKFLRVYPYHETTGFNDQVTMLSRDSEEGIDKLKDMVRCIMLRRSIARVSLPGRHDTVSKLNFSPQELDAYNCVKDLTLEALGDTTTQSYAGKTHFNVLSWMQKLLMICSLGSRAGISDCHKPAATTSGRDTWDTATAQQAFNRLVTVGEAVCESCTADLVSVVTEVADPVPGRSFHPVLFSCLQLVCGLCQERSSGRLTCKHDIPCSSSVVSTLSSSTHNRIDTTSQNRPGYASSQDTPTKVKALLQDLLIHYGTEKRCVPAK